ncbi:MAG: glycosyltransferase [Cyanobacteria bacterium P01_C01_bin.120]
MTLPTASRPPKTVTAHLNRIIFLALVVCGFLGLYFLQNPGQLAIWNIFGLVSLGLIGIWRWSWFLVRMMRARIYLHWVFPRWRRTADSIPVDVLPHVCFLVPTYKEEPWISERVFRAIAQEAKTLAPHPITVLVNSSSDEENAFVRSILEAEDPGLKRMRVIWMTQKDGKRKAMADGLRELAKLNLPADSVIALMDGDSELGPGTLRRCLPFFRLFPQMGALTTDEIPVVKGSYLFSEWFHMRFAQRHSQMCSDSLSNKVMCLTGRFSLFRAEAALAPSFADQLEHDSLEDWLWGRFKFLSGDDKSTWYWLLRHRYDMLYVPDAIVYSIETVSGSVTDRAYNNMRRWYGNMLRNSSRALALGPKTTGWFIWYSLIDQRISYWTCLITPGFLLVTLLQGNWLGAMVVISWLCFSRPLMLGLIFWGRMSEIKPIHFPLLLVSQWSSSLIKIWTQMNLAQQKWSNRGNQSISAAGTGFERVAKRSTARFLLATQLFCFGIFLSWFAGTLNPGWDLQGWRLSYAASQQSVLQIDALEHGIQPSDGKDDAAAINALLADLPPQTDIVVNLPIGELDLLAPLHIERSNVMIKGKGTGRTILQAHFGGETADAVIRIRPESSQLVASAAAQKPTAIADKLQNVRLSGFTLRLAVGNGAIARQPALDGILVDNVETGTLTHLAVEAGTRQPLVMHQTGNIRVEYFADNNPTPAAEDDQPGEPQLEAEGLSSRESTL